LMSVRRPKLEPSLETRLEVKQEAAGARHVA